MDNHSSFPVHELTSAAGSSVQGQIFADIGGALVLILIVAVALIWFARRMRLVSSDGRGNVFSIINSRSVGQRERIVVVEIEGKWLLLGVTSANITFLTMLDKPDGKATESSEPLMVDFQSALAGILKKRRSENRE